MQFSEADYLFNKTIMIKNAEEFVRLRKSKNQQEYARAAHDEAPIEVWYEVIANYPDMIIWVVQNKTVPYELLELLADSHDARVRSMIASKNKLKEPLLIKLATDKNDSVRMSIARHKKATRVVIELLVNDNWREISQLASERIKNGRYR